MILLDDRQPGELLDPGEKDQIIDALEFYLDTVLEDYLESPEENGPSYQAKLRLYYVFTGQDFFGPRGYLSTNGVPNEG